MTCFRARNLGRPIVAALATAIAALPASAHADEQADSVNPPAAPVREQPASDKPARDKGVLSMSTGISYSRGDYGEIEDTQVVSVPLALRYRQGPWRFRLSLPWVHILGPGSLLQTPEGRDSGIGGDNLGGAPTSPNSGSGSSGSGTSGSSGSGSSGSGSGSSGSGSGSSGSGSGGSGSGSSGSGSGGTGTAATGGGTIGTGTAGGVVRPGTNLADNRRSGLGDLSAALTYSFDFGGGFYADVTGKVKIPTASRAKRMGTGRADFTASADLIKDVGPASFYLSGRRKFAGKPTGSTIRSVWGAGGGASVRVARGMTIGADYNWQQSSFALGAGSSEITGWTSFRLNRALGLTLYAGAGLDRASTDLLGGATVSVRF